MDNSGKQKRKGSLLLEALLTVVILSVSITLIIQSMTSSLRASVYSADYTKAALLMENKMFELLQDGFIESGRRVEGSFDKPFEKFRYLVTTKAESRESLSKINNVDMEITWNTGSKENRISLQTLLFDAE